MVDGVLEFSATLGVSLGPTSQHLLGACEKCRLSCPTLDILFQNLHFIETPSDSYIHYGLRNTDTGCSYVPYAPRIKLLWMGSGIGTRKKSWENDRKKISEGQGSFGKKKS